MRKKVLDGDKKKTISVSLHPILIEMVEKYTKDKNKFKIIGDLLKDYFNKKK